MFVKINLERLLKEREISQLELSKKTSIRPASIHEMVHNQTQRLPLSNLAAICVVLDCEISDILTLEKEPTE